MGEKRRRRRQVIFIFLIFIYVISESRVTVFTVTEKTGYRKFDLPPCLLEKLLRTQVNKIQGDKRKSSKANTPSSFYIQASVWAATSWVPSLSVTFETLSILQGSTQVYQLPRAFADYSKPEKNSPPSELPYCLMLVIFI